MAAARRWQTVPSSSGLGRGFAKDFDTQMTSHLLCSIMPLSVPRDSHPDDLRISLAPLCLKHEHESPRLAFLHLKIERYH